MNHKNCCTLDCFHVICKHSKIVPLERNNRKKRIICSYPIGQQPEYCQTLKDIREKALGGL